MLALFLSQNKLFKRFSIGFRDSNKERRSKVVVVVVSIIFYISFVSSNDTAPGAVAGSTNREDDTYYYYSQRILQTVHCILYGKVTRFLINIPYEKIFKRTILLRFECVKFCEIIINI